jgi:hypothetical protein
MPQIDKAKTKELSREDAKLAKQTNYSSLQGFPLRLGGFA